ncbi:MAG: hypothetical protein WD005_02600 [Haliea sp.]
MLSYRSMLNCRGAGLGRKRLKALLEIARSHHLSLDRLDEQSRGLDSEAFYVWTNYYLTDSEAAKLGLTA